MTLLQPTRRALIVKGLSTAAGLALPASACGSSQPENGGDARRRGTGLKAGRFEWVEGDFSRQLAADPLGGLFIARADDPEARLGAWRRVTEGDIRPEWFGALGDGVTNDTKAFAAMAAMVSFLDGGEVVLRRTTYLVGGQRRTPGRGKPFAYEPAPIIEIAGCRGDVIIRGNGARLRCEAGLRYGTFDVRNGRATKRPQPFYGTEERASPYWAMIHLRDCQGAIEVRDIELDGNLGRLMIGGPWGDTGHQIGAFGIALYNNLGSELLSDVFAHDHPMDGLYIDGADTDRPERSILVRVRCENNGRQGCSVVGGRRYDFKECIFSRTGRGGLASAPAAGLNVEAEASKKVRDLSFERCLFADNVGVGLLFDQGDGADARVDGCRLIGTTNWAAWPRKPGLAFNDCTFVGPIVNCWGDSANPARATQFRGCRFVDDPALSPTGLVFTGTTDKPIADLPNNPNVKFARCMFQLTHRNVLPWTTVTVIFEDCVMTQTSKTVSYPRGTFVGTNRITGMVDMNGARNRGNLAVNGVRQPKA